MQSIENARQIKALRAELSAPPVVGELSVGERARAMGIEFDQFVYRCVKVGIESTIAKKLYSGAITLDMVTPQIQGKMCDILQISKRHKLRKECNPGTCKLVGKMSREDMEKMLLEQYGDKYRWEQTRTAKNNTPNLSVNSFLGHYIQSNV